jgi:superfamily I DNA/RNA helicase
MPNRSDIAVLARTRRALTAIERTFQRLSIPMVNTAQLRKVKPITKEAHDILAYCECIGVDDCTDAVVRIYNRPARQLSKSVMDKVVATATSKKMSIIRVMQFIEAATAAGAGDDFTKRQRQSLGSFVQMIISTRETIREMTSTLECMKAVIEASEYQSFMSKRCKGEKLATKQAGIDALLARCRQFDSTSFGQPSTTLTPDSSSSSSSASTTATGGSEDGVARLYKFVHWLKRTAAAEERAAEGKKLREQHVALTSIHQAKGLEWPLVVGSLSSFTCMFVVHHIAPLDFIVCCSL